MPVHPKIGLHDLHPMRLSRLLGRILGHRFIMLPCEQFSGKRSISFPYAAVLFPLAELPPISRCSAYPSGHLTVTQRLHRIKYVSPFDTSVRGVGTSVLKRVLFPLVSAHMTVTLNHLPRAETVPPNNIAHNSALIHHITML